MMKPVMIAVAMLTMTAVSGCTNDDSASSGDVAGKADSANANEILEGAKTAIEVTDLADWKNLVGYGEGFVYLVVTAEEGLTEQREFGLVVQKHNADLCALINCDVGSL